MSRSKIINLTMPVFFILFSIWVILTSMSMGRMEGTFPRMVGAFTLIVALFQLHFDVKKTDHKDKFTGCNVPKVLEAITVLAIYVYTLNKIGYIIGTALLAFYVMRSLGYRKYRVSITMSLVFSLGAFFIFRVLLGVPLPTIWLDF